jgi:histidine ammonia-lyase
MPLIDHHITRDINLITLEKLYCDKSPLQLSEQVRTEVEHCRRFLDNVLANNKGLIYGINTGFGSLCDVRISDDETSQLQINLVRSHACGTGAEIPQHIVRWIMLLKILNLAKAKSGIQPATLDLMIALYNAKVYPIIYEQGSLGASGDLAPLAHLSLMLLSEGQVNYMGKRQAASEVFRLLGLEPVDLQAKEGLALLNGTQFSTAFGVWTCLQAQKLNRIANMTGALSADAFFCRQEPFHPSLHKIRIHQGQIDTAAIILQWLKDSPIAEIAKQQVQDPYSFRCMPQVHGASADAIQYVSDVMEREVNAVTDNPNVFPEEELILSGGNFHAQPIALPMDYLALGISELGNISERRLYQLIGGQRQLPPFLTRHSGLHSGMMIAQYTAASIVSQNKQLCSPASIDSIVSCNGQEDHVSMAANGATRLYKMVENAFQILAIEWMAAAQALEFRRPLKTAPPLETLLEDYRKLVPMLEEDRPLYEDMQNTANWLKELEPEF